MSMDVPWVFWALDLFYISALAFFVYVSAKVLKIASISPLKAVEASVAYFIVFMVSGQVLMVFIKDMSTAYWLSIIASVLALSGAVKYLGKAVWSKSAIVAAVSYGLLYLTYFVVLNYLLTVSYGP